MNWGTTDHEVVTRGRNLRRINVVQVTAVTDAAHLHTVRGVRPVGYLPSESGLLPPDPILIVPGGFAPAPAASSTVQSTSFA